MKKSKKTTNKSKTNKKLPVGITMDNESFRVRKMIKGTSFSANFGKLKDAKSYLNLLKTN